MARNRYKQYIGTTIGKFLILEELGTIGNTPQARYSNRRFRVRDSESGLELVMRMSALRNKKGPKYRSTYTQFHDLTGETVGNWEVLSLANDGPIEKGDKTGSLWNARHVLTGEKAVLPYKDMKPRRCSPRGKHGCRTALYTHPLYNTWSALRSSTGNQSDVRWHNWGGRGYTIDRTRWNQFVNFKNDILKTAGDRPDSHAVLMPISGRHFSYGNVEWRYRINRQIAATVPGNLRPKMGE